MKRNGPPPGVHGRFFPHSGAACDALLLAFTFELLPPSATRIDFTDSPAGDPSVLEDPDGFVLVEGLDSFFGGWLEGIE